MPYYNSRLARIGLLLVLVLVLLLYLHLLLLLLLLLLAQRSLGLLKREPHW